MTGSVTCGTWGNTGISRSLSMFKVSPAQTKTSFTISDVMLSLFRMNEKVTGKILL